MFPHGRERPSYHDEIYNRLMVQAPGMTVVQLGLQYHPYALRTKINHVECMASSLDPPGLKYVHFIISMFTCSVVVFITAFIFDKNTGRYASRRCIRVKTERSCDCGSHR